MDCRICNERAQKALNALSQDIHPKAIGIAAMSTSSGAIRFVNTNDEKNVFAVKLQIHQNLQLDQEAVS